MVFWKNRTHIRIRVCKLRAQSVVAFKYVRALDDYAFVFYRYNYNLLFGHVGASIMGVL